MSSRRRDRHGRGLRGPLAGPNPLVSRPASPPRPSTPSEAFADAVHAAVERVARQCPEAVVDIAFGIEDVPGVELAWSGQQVPLALAIEATADRPSQLVVYRRPLEHRASSRRGLRTLVYRTVVEQLAALTGRSVTELDPDGAADEDDDDD
jgi:predicted Zn-dependent protease with MMP-like domain